MVITLERYFKIVHAIAHRKYYRKWMTKVGVVLPWMGGTCLILFPAMGTTRIVNGRCLRMGVWPNEAMRSVSPHVLIFCRIIITFVFIHLAIIWEGNKVFTYWKLHLLLRKEHRVSLGRKFCSMDIRQSLIMMFVTLRTKSQRKLSWVGLFPCTERSTGWRKNGATLSHCKYSENSMTELRGNWWTSAILYAEHSH